MPADPANLTETSKLDHRPLILLAEDDEMSIKVGTRMLERQGCRVIAVEDGCKALHALEEYTFDMIFMDIQMPVMNGLEATKRIRESNTTYASIPIVALTSYAMAVDKERFLEAGMDEYISKPISMDRIASVLRQYVSKRLRLHS